MKKVFFSLIVLFIYNEACFSQKKSYLTIAAGPSFPFGKFSNKDFNYNTYGLASTGQSLNINYASTATNKIGFAFELRGQRNPLGKKSLKKSLNDSKFLNQVIYTGTPPLATYTSYTNWKVKTASWLSVAANPVPRVILPVIFNSQKMATRRFQL